MDTLICQRTWLKRGDKVRPGQIIGLISEDHLHFGVRFGNYHI
jgi:murein DD-endopeptidase MepM/ murein hydrolase activator NlpD